MTTVEMKEKERSALLVSEVQKKKLLINTPEVENTERCKRKGGLGKGQGRDLRVKGHNTVDMNSQCAPSE